MDEEVEELVEELNGIIERCTNILDEGEKDQYVIDISDNCYAKFTKGEGGRFTQVYPTEYPSEATWLSYAEAERVARDVRNGAGEVGKPILLTEALRRAIPRLKSTRAFLRKAIERRKRAGRAQ